jgi:hypothetical protein
VLELLHNVVVVVSNLAVFVVFLVLPVIEQVRTSVQEIRANRISLLLHVVDVDVLMKNRIFEAAAWFEGQVGELIFDELVAFP